MIRLAVSRDILRNGVKELSLGYWRNGRQGITGQGVGQRERGSGRAREKGKRRGGHNGEYNGGDSRDSG